MTKGNRPRQRRFLSFQYASAWRLFFILVVISSPQKCAFECIFAGSSTIWFRLQPSQFIGHCPGVDSLVEYFLVRCLFQAFRWAENGASREQREITSGIEREIIESIARQRPSFYCQGRRPTQLIDPQLIMYFVFTILKTLLKDTWILLWRNDKWQWQS